MNSRIKLGMILFIVSEAVFFLLLVLAYVSFHKSGRGVEAAAMLDPVKTGFFSLALFSSSFTVWCAESAQKKGMRSRAALWLLGTIALGSVFLLGQGVEYATLLKNKVTISRDLFGTTFFTLTGFHGLHVFVGLLLLTLLLGLAVAGRKNEPAVPAVESIAIYWHFVDGVWVVIFSIVYLWRFF